MQVLSNFQSDLRIPSSQLLFARISGKSYGKFGQNQWKIWAKPMENSGKSIWKIWAKAMRKLGKRRHIFRAKIIAFARISIAFIRISHCFFPNSPLLLSKFPMAFARIFHGFCPNFSFSKLFGGHSAPPAPPPHTPMVDLVTVIRCTLN